jgi:hypothetical protein
MFYREKSNQYIQEGQPFEINGTFYPANWLNCTTLEEKNALGLVEVTTSNQPEDDRFYWVSATMDGAVRTYTNTPKDLDKLKTQWTTQIRATAYSLLLPSDWMVVKSIETQTTVPDEWNVYRSAVRYTCSNAVNAILAATDIPTIQEAIKITWPRDPNSKNDIF